MPPKTRKYYVKDLKKQYPDMPPQCLRCQLFLEAQSYRIPYRVLNEVSKSGKTILLIAMNPGKEEDKTGQILVGKSGKLLQKYVDEYLSDHKVLATNAVKCYNGDVQIKKAHINECNEYLKEDIENIKPDIIVTLGKVAKEAYQEVYNERD